MIRKEIHDCRTCIYMKEVYEAPRHGMKVACLPIDYYGSQAMREIPRIASEKECSIYKLSESRLKALLEGDGKERMPDSVALAIRTEWADRIYFGKKRWEYRTTIWTQPGIRKVVLYESSPRQAVTGEFTVGQVLKGTPEDIWRETGHDSGMTKSQFMSMFEGKALVCAVEARNPTRYPKGKSILELGLAFIPQSFAYIPKT